MIPCAYIGILERKLVGSGVGCGGEMLDRMLLHEHWIAPVGLGVTWNEGHALSACTSCVVVIKSIYVTSHKIT